MPLFRLKAFFRELRRRRVFNTVAIYIAGAWMTLEAADLAFPGLDIPESAIRYVWMGAFLLLPLVLVLGWRYDISAQRITRTAGAGEAEGADVSLRRFDYLLISSLGVIAVSVIGVMLYQVQHTEPDQAQVESVVKADNSIAVMPLSWCGDNAGEAAVAGGIHNAVIYKLAAYNRLAVKSRSWVYKMVESNLSPVEAASVFPVQYLVNGELCRIGKNLVMEVELTDHAHSLIWSGSFRQKVNELDRVEQPLADLVSTGIAVELGEVAAIRRVDPVDEQALYKLREGQHHRMQGNSQKARAAFEEALEYQPEYAEALYELSLVIDAWEESLVGGMRKARPIAEKALAFARADIERGVADYKPHWVTARILLALSYWEQDLSWRAANALTEQQIAANKAYARSMIKEAEQHLRAAIRINPSEPDLRKALYRTLARQGVERWDEAFEVLQQLREAEPFDIWVANRMAHELAERGQFRRAVEELERFEVLGEIPGHLRWVQLQLQKGGRPDESLELLIHMLQHEPGKFIKGHLTLGHLYWSTSGLVALGLHEEAASLYQSLSTIPYEEGDWVRQFFLKDAYLRSIGRAAEVAQRNLAEFEGMSNEEILDEYYLQAAFAADAFLDVGETERALDLYEALSQMNMMLDEKPGEWTFNLIWIYMEAGRVADAEPLLSQSIHYLEEEVAAGNRNFSYLEALAEAYALNGQDDEALRMLKMAVDYGCWNLVDELKWFARQPSFDPWQVLRDDPRFIRQEQRAQALKNQKADNARNLLATHDIDALLRPVIETLEAEIAGSGNAR